MAPRKAAKHPDSELVERAAEAGDISPPKRKKAAAKVAAKNDEEKQVRLPRAAKSGKTELKEPEAETAPVATKTSRAKGKAGKNVPAPAKVNVKAKAAGKKAKEIEDKDDGHSAESEESKPTEEKPATRTRTKATPKKAGTGNDEEQKPKPKGRAKRSPATAPAAEPHTSESSSPKKRKIVSKETKPKGRAAKQKVDETAETKTKGSDVTNNDAEKNGTDKRESPSSQKKIRTVNEEKTTKPVRKTRGKKNENILEAVSEDGEAAKADVDTASENSQGDGKEAEESQSPQSDSADSTQQSKRGRNAKKKDETVAPKKGTKTRGKAANREDDATAEEDIDSGKGAKDSQRKIGKEAASPVPAAKKGRGKKAGGVVGKEDSSDKKAQSENATAEEKKILNSGETLLGNNNVQTKEDETVKSSSDLDVKEMKTIKSTVEKEEDFPVVKNDIKEQIPEKTTVAH